MRFILIDEILEVNPGKHIRAIKHVAPDEDYFRDHFPGFPVVPGVLLTEMMAQTAGKCLEMEDCRTGQVDAGAHQQRQFQDMGTARRAGNDRCQDSDESPSFCNR